MSSNVDRFVPEAGALFQRFADGAVVYSPGDETYFGLNSTGAQVWGLLSKDGSAFEELHQKMVELYPSVSAEELRADLRGLLDDLVNHGLLRRVTVEAAA